MLQGNFVAAASAACNSNKQLTLKTPVGTSIPITNNMLDPANFDPVALAYLKYIPVSTDPCGRILQYGISGAAQHGTANRQLVGKVDYQKSDRHSIFARYFWPHYIAPAYFNGTNALTTPSYALNNRIHTLVGGDTIAINPTHDQHACPRDIFAFE